MGITLLAASRLWQTRAAVGAQTPSSVFVTAADGPEGSVMVAALLQLPVRLTVIAGVEDPASPTARSLRSAGAELRQLSGLHPHSSAFAGADWVFFLAPLTADRLARGRAFIDAAWKGGVRQAILLSVIGAGAGVPPSLGAYFALEEHLASTWLSGSSTILRTYFYQQNLSLWASDARRTASLRLPLAHDACFAPLYEGDVAAVVVALMAAEPPAPAAVQRAQILNLTGPDLLSGYSMAKAASEASGSSLSFQTVSRPQASQILQAAGGVDASEAELLLDLLALQTSQENCHLWPSRAVHDITGQHARPITAFFSEHAADFRHKDDLVIM